jgi:hypothetical protein
VGERYRRQFKIFIEPALVMTGTEPVDRSNSSTEPNLESLLLLLLILHRRKP